MANARVAPPQITPLPVDLITPGYATDGLNKYKIDCVLVARCVNTRSAAGRDTIDYRAADVVVVVVVVVVASLLRPQRFIIIIAGGRRRRP